MKFVPYFMLGFFLSFFSGCASPIAQKLDPEVYYKNDMDFSYGDAKFNGVGVIPYSPTIKLKIDAHDNIDKFVLTTCHREVDSDDPDRGLFRKNGVVKIELTPTLEIEKACPYYFGSFGRDGSYSAGVVLVVDHKKYSLPATVNCNGKVDKAVGAYICESKSNLIQRISFSEPVALARPTNGPAQRSSPCPVLELSDDQKSIEFKLPSRECLYGVIGRDTRKEFQFYTIGHEALIVR